MLRMAISSIKQPNIGIIGAGFAGLRCADMLLKRGAKVTIFEARNRVGGRVAQSKLNGHTVDLGPNWIHGTDNNPIMHLAQQTGTNLHTWDESSAVWNSAGDQLSAKQVGEYAGLLWDDGLIADAFKYSNEHGDRIDPQRSLYDYLVERTQQLFSEFPASDAACKRETFLQYASIWGAYIGSPFTRQSLRFFWLEEVIEGENPFVASSYDKILAAVAKHAQDEAQIHLNTPVVQIEAGEKDVRKPALQTESGDRHEFDEIIITTPLGWLKRNKSAFTPALDAGISKAIDNIGYGTLDKVYIMFPSAFWQNEEHEQHAKTAATGFLQWLAPIDGSNATWGQNGMNMAALPGDCSHPTLLFYVFGDCAVHIADIVKSSSNKAATDRELVDFFKPYFSKLPNYDSTLTQCQPSGVLATVWANDEYAGYGSYTNFQTGLEAGDKDIQAMRQGMPEQSLWFAGEHTAPYIAMGTTTGAYWSGEAVAQRIIEAYKLEEHQS